MSQMIPVARPSFSHLEEKYLSDAMKSGYISASGKYLDLFEKKFAEYHGMKYAVSCSNGTAALHLSLLSLKIGRGQEVIIPNLAFAAVRNAVLYQRSTPVYCEIDPETWNIDPDRIFNLINSRTKAIIAVHTYGNPCDMRPIMEICTKNGIHLIEDCAESFGSKYEKQLCGTFSTVSCFSFYGNKTITTGQGGMILTDSEEIAKQARLYKNQAMTEPYCHVDVGYNYRMTNLEASIGLAQIERAPQILHMKEEITKNYRNLPYTMQFVTPRASPVFWMNVIRVPEPISFRKYLLDHEIETRPCFQPFNPSFRVSKDVAEHLVCLPSGPNLSEKELKRVMEVVNEFYAANHSKN